MLIGVEELDLAVQSTSSAPPEIRPSTYNPSLEDQMREL